MESLEKTEKRTRGDNLQTQRAKALRDAEDLQHLPEKFRTESYKTECKLATARLLTLDRMISRRERDNVQPLKDEISRLKQKISALELELETKQKSAESVAPKDPVVARMLAEAEEMRRKGSGESVVRPTPLPSMGDSFPPGLSVPAQVRLTPPRADVVQLPDTLAQPRPVIPASEVEKKAVSRIVDSQFRNVDANVERIIRDAKRQEEGR